MNSVGFDPDARAEFLVLTGSLPQGINYAVKGAESAVCIVLAYEAAE